MNIQTLTVSSRENTTFVTKKSYLSMRQETTIFLFQLRHLLFTGRVKHNVVEELLRPFSLYLEQLNTLPIIEVLHTVHSSRGNDVSHDSIQYKFQFLSFKFKLKHTFSLRHRCIICCMVTSNGGGYI